jgi:4-hydroxybenzoate polyprenyltransferase
MHEGATPLEKLTEGFHAFWIINRFEALLAYNIGYFLIIAAIPQSTDVLVSRLDYLLMFFVAVVLMKGHASIADAIHDYALDEDNPQKSYVPRSVDFFGESNAWTLLVVQILVSIFFYGYLTYVTGSLVFLLAGVVLAFFGFTYSYPPRFKEQGVYNHLMTSTVDVTCLLLPGALLMTGELSAEILAVVTIVFFYSFAYHVLHQAGDTYYDRSTGIDTFTQTIGVNHSLVLSAMVVLLATAIAIVFELFLFALAAFVFTAWFIYLYASVRDDHEQQQSDVVSDGFRISRCATTLNVSLAVNLFLIDYWTQLLDLLPV